MQANLGRLIAASLLLALLLPAARAQGIFTCVDGKGRKITADRPIVDCIDREQREITPTGSLVRKIGPSMTAAERAAEEEKQRRDLDERNRLLEEKKRDRALLVRYPDRATHDKERVAAIGTIDDVIATANRRTAELVRQRNRFELELEFFKGDLKKAPPHLKRQIDDLDGQIAAQNRFVQNQDVERKRVDARYQEELGRLSSLWAQHAAPPVSAASKPAAAGSKAASMAKK